MQLSSRAAGIPGSLNLALNARAQELQARCGDVVNMSVGEPDFGAPQVVRAAAAEKALGGDVRYTPAGGTRSLREAIARYLSESRGVPFEAEEVTVCHSAKHALSGTILALVEDGDEVLLPAPSWLSYVEQIRIAGGRAVWVASRPDLGPDFDALRGAVGPRTRGVMINSPNNPSGYVWTRAEMEALAALAAEQDLWILSDEIYRRLCYEGPPNPSPVEIDPETRARTVVVDGASKAFAMTGYRIGFLAAPAEIAAGVMRVHSHLTGSPNAIAQAAYESALAEEPAEVARMVAAYDARRRELVPALNALGLTTPMPRGAYYALCDVRPWLDERGVAGFCEDLLADVHLATVPGTVFGIEGWMRLSFALPLEACREAVARLERFLASRPRRDAAAATGSI